MIVIPFVRRHQEIIKKIGPINEKKLWINTFIFSLFILLGTSIYLFFQRGQFNANMINNSIANASMILIGLSFALSGLCYFWDFVDSKIIYRKYLGLIGFAFALAHIFLAFFIFSEKFPYPQWYLSNIWSVITALIAILIFTMMAFISNKYAIHELGGLNWRRLLRVGYIAYVFVIIHITLLSYPWWVRWLTTFNTILPPLSLIIVLFALFVIVLRIALLIAIEKHKKIMNIQSNKQNISLNKKQNTKIKKI